MTLNQTLLPPAPELEFTIPGAPCNPYIQISAKYNYDKNKCLCPNCGGSGIPWAGWFHCDECRCVAVVADGRSFVPVKNVE